MVSFHISSSTEQQRISSTEYSDENYSSSKKRKWGGILEEETTTRDHDQYSMAFKISKAESAQPLLDISFHLETPLPSEWQQCLDLQSGQVHFYNTRTHKRTNRDPRDQSPEPFTSSLPMSLDLELNLPCEPTRTTTDPAETTLSPNSDHDSNSDLSSREYSGGGLIRGATKSLPWVSLEEGQEEMMAAVCMRCHMLVMLCKSSPTCPNCKFLHPPYMRNAASNQHFKPTGLRLLCCED